jgi:hypothetical protein
LRSKNITATGPAVHVMSEVQTWHGPDALSLVSGLRWTGGLA